MASEALPAYRVRHRGPANNLDHRVFLENSTGEPISPWHDIPLFANKEKNILNMVVEIPRWSNAKLEITKDELMNPIKQDVKKGKLRFVRNCFPHHGYIWNYGAFPQTWEDPNHTHPDTGAKGDNDPLDVCEIGEAIGYVGEVKEVKVLGVMALLDEGETDWKVIVIDVKDPLAPELNDIKDVERLMPGLIQSTHDWFKIYKIPDGKPENAFAFDGEAKDHAYAISIVHECHEAWNGLINSQHPSHAGLRKANVTVNGSPDRITANNPDTKYEALPPHEPGLAPDPIDASVSKWFYIREGRSLN